MKSGKLKSRVKFCLTLLLLTIFLTPTCFSLATSSPLDSMLVVDLEQEPQNTLLAQIPESKDILKGVDFELIDQHALDTPEWAEETVKSLAAYLIEPAQNDLEKVRAIFRWITHNISYDVVTFYNIKEGVGPIADQSAEGALASRKVVCAGYAKLFKALALHAGLEAEYIIGWTNGSDFAFDDPFDGLGHAWNAVKIDDNWYLLDVTWSAGHVKEKQFVRRLNEFYFLTPPEQLIYSHFPENSDWQLLEVPVTREAFAKLLNVRPSFFIHNLEPISHHQHTIEAKRSVTIIISAPEDIHLSSALELENHRLSRSLTHVQRVGDYYAIEAVFSGPEDYCLFIFAGKKEQRRSMAVHYRIKVSEGLPEMIRFSLEHPEPFEHLVPFGKLELVSYLADFLKVKAPMNLNRLDIGIIIVLGIIILLGMKQGILKSVVSLIALVSGVLLASRFYHFLAELLNFKKNEDQYRIIFIFLIFIAVNAIVFILGTAICTKRRIVFHVWANLLGGAILGFAKGWIICSVVLLTLHVTLFTGIRKMPATELNRELEVWRNFEPIQLLETIRLRETTRLSIALAVKESIIATTQADYALIVYELVQPKLDIEYLDGESTRK